MHRMQVKSSINYTDQVKNTRIAKECFCFTSIMVMAGDNTTGLMARHKHCVYHLIIFNRVPPSSAIASHKEANTWKRHHQKHSDRKD